MPTARQIAAQRRQARRELERDRRKRDRARLQELRVHVRNARAGRGPRQREIRKLCRRGTIAAREAGKAIRAHYRAVAASEIARERSAARNSCESRKQKARAKAANSVDRAIATLEAERAHQATMRRWEDKPRHTHIAKELRRSAAERIAESDSEVANNLPDELLPVWRVMKRKIKGSARRTRTEAFMEWCSDHQADVYGIVHAQYERDAAYLARNEARLRKQVDSPAAYAKMTDRQLSADDVPF